LFPELVSTVFEVGRKWAGTQKKGKLLISHRYDHIPLLDSSPGGVCGSWSYKTYPSTKIRIFCIFAKKKGTICDFVAVFREPDAEKAAWMRMTAKKRLLVVFIAAVAVGATVALVFIFQFFGDAVRERSDLYISARTDYPGLLDSLRPRTDHHWAFDRYAGRLELERSFKPGHYVLEPGMNVVEIARMLKLGMQTPVRVTLNYARTRAFLASRLARQLDADSAELMRALTDPQLAREVGTDSLQLFSIFIPNTYEFYWTVSPEDFVRRMRKEYDRFWTPERDAARRRSGLSRDEVMTLASIVTEETNKADEMPRVAGVYINRLRKGMPLQADPTVKYALQDFSLRRILHKHLRTPSPYNTYLNKGLPPSSIAMPSVAAIDGVLNFENHDYLFFCARPTFDGYHSFARTYGEHLANARAYSAELNRRNIK